jgi:acetylornithine deacetylase/succinyl-diaminopimelate desuccinylase-like protein
MTVTTETLVDLLEQIVNIPSVTGNEQAIADWITRRLASASRGEVIRHGLSVIWRAPRRGRPLVVLAGHTDTVPPQGNTTARRDGDRLYGLGTTDMKAGDAVMLAIADTIDLDAMPYRPRVRVLRRRGGARRAQRSQARAAGVAVAARGVARDPARTD